MSHPFRVSKPLLIAAGVLLGAPLVVSAQPAGPHVEAGLWETGMEVSGFKMNSQICMDGSEASSRRAFMPPSREQAAGAAERNCEKQDIHPVAGGYSVNATCTNSQGRVTHISGTVTGDFRSHYAMDMTVENNGRPQTMHMESHRVGACPAGMRPGEARTQMDQGGIAAAVAAARARAAAGGGQ
jgi:hypothetical protein